MHLDEGQLLRVLHRELADAEDRAAQDHLAECSDCRDRLAEAKREEEAVFRILGIVDHPAPRVPVGDIASRARKHGIGRFRWAAGVVLALGAAGAAYAVPGSPVRVWVAAVADWIQSRQAPAHQTPAPVQPAERPTAGIAMTPSRHFVIHFIAAQTEGLARISLTAGTEVVVQGPIGVATYTSGVNRLEINNVNSSGDFEIQIPASAPWVEIRVGEGRILLKDGLRVTTAGPAGSPPYVLRMTPR